MTHTYAKLLFHLVWSAKNRRVFIDESLKIRLYSYTRELTKDKQQHLTIINGMPDHIHMLVNLRPTICLSDDIKDIKASSTKWVSKTFDNIKDFGWQEGYAAYTVGYSTEEKVISYIQNQEKHHANMTFEEEYMLFLNRQKMSFDPRFVLD